MSEIRNHITSDNVATFRALFTGLPTAYGTLDLTTRQVHQVKSPVTDEVLRAHLEGRQPYGVYLLVEDRIRTLAVDFDTDDLSGPKAFVKAGQRRNLPGYLERSKSKGYHVWIFFSEPVLAKKARSVARLILKEINQPHTEIFPKQDRLDSRTSFGNFIFVPLFAQWVAQNRTIFLDPDDPSRPCSDPWALLKSVHRVSEATLDNILQTDEMPTEYPRPENGGSAPRGPGDAWFVLPPCIRTILAHGVTRNQRDTCFRLAVHFYRLGLPVDIALPALNAWAAKNRPEPGRNIITDPEIIAQATSAYKKGYRGFGCQTPAIAEFCSPACVLKQRERENPDLEGGGRE